MSAAHPLAAILRDAAFGRFPEPGLQVLPALDGIEAGIFGFSAHTIIAADLDPSEVEAQIAGRDPGAPMNPLFIAWLSHRLEARCYVPDAVLVAFRPAADAATALVERPDLLDHPRAVMAQRYRRDVRAYSAAGGDGLLTLGRGICDRYEVSVEVEPALRNRGLGRRLAYEARSLVPNGEPVFASISPGNAASMRAFLAAGYVPIGTEVAMVRGAVRETTPAAAAE